MLTTKHDAGHIKSWLLQSFSNKKWPVETVSDGSSALLNGLSLAFNKCSYKEYLKFCIRYAKGEITELSLNERFNTYLREDRARKLKATHDWKCFPRSNGQMRDFYTRCIGYVILLTDLSEIKEILMGIFIISESQTMSVGSECAKQYDVSIKKFTKIKIDPVETAKSFSGDFSKTVEIDECEVDVEDWILQVYGKASKLTNDSTSINAVPNKFYCPKIRKNLIRIFNQVPAWTNLMQKAFKSPNDVAVKSEVEESYKDLKQLIPHPLTVPMFFLTHIKNLGATMNVTKSYLLNENVSKIIKLNERKCKQPTIKVLDTRFSE